MIAAAGRTFPAARLSIYQARNTTFHPKYNCKTQQYRTWIQHMKRTWNMQEDQETNVQTTSITFSHVRTEQSRSADLHRAHDRKIHRFQITHDPADSGDMCLRSWQATQFKAISPTRQQRQHVAARRRLMGQQHYLCAACKFLRKLCSASDPRLRWRRRRGSMYSAHSTASKSRCRC